jgi:tRNA (cmo5U34)-methyltransferase
MRQDSVGHGIMVPKTGWSFGGNVWCGFDQHIRASVPGYAAQNRLIVDLASQFLGGRRRACDLGCSTGTLSVGLARRFAEADIIGVDIEPTMIAAAKRLSNSRPRYICADLMTFPFPEMHLATICYTLMFLPPEQRLTLLTRLRLALLPGAGLILAEKVVRRDPAEEAYCQAQHLAFKRRQGLSQEQIEAKSASIKGCLIPLYEDENIDLLERAGFSGVQLISRHACFDAWLARR